MTFLSLAETQSSQRKARYAGDQNCEKAQFWSHFMPLRGRSKFHPQGCWFAMINLSLNHGKNIPSLCPLWLE